MLIVAYMAANISYIPKQKKNHIYLYSAHTIKSFHYYTDNKNAVHIRMYYNYR